ncbi:MAG: tetratricopeptide repeat protein [Bacteroidota bacterium]
MKQILILTLLLSHLLFSGLFAQPSGKNAQNSTIDSLLQVLKTAKEDTSKVNTLNQLGLQYISISSNDLSLQYSQQAHKLTEHLISINTKDTELRVLKKANALAYNTIGRANLNVGNYETALDCFLKSLKLKEEMGDQKGIANAYNNIGIIYYYRGNYEKSLENYLKSLKIREDINDKPGTAMTYSNIGTVYINQENYEKALPNFYKYLKVSTEIGDKQGMCNSYNNIGLVFYFQGILSKSKTIAAEKMALALENYTKSLKLTEEIGNIQGVVTSYNNIGNIYEHQGNYEKALSTHLKSLKTSEEIGDKNGTLNSYLNIGNINLKQNKLKDADSFLNNALTLSKELGKKDGIKASYGALSDLYEKKGDYKQAHYYHKLYSEIKDTLLNEESSKQMTEMSAKYDSEQKDKAIQLLNKDKETQASLAIEEKRRQQVILYSVLGFSILVIVFSLFIYRNLRQKKKLNIELEKLSIVARETDNGVLICGPNGEIEWCNTGLTRLLGYTLEDLKQKGNTLEEISSSSEIKTIIHQSIENKKPSTYQSLNISKDGKARWMQSTLTPILDNAGNLKKLVVIDMDVTDRKQADDEIRQKNQNITDSLNYAKRIQQAILPSREFVKTFIPDSCILFNPKNIVSGDFYWIHPINEHEVLIAAVDCTGHGVPGAFMSIMSFNLLEQLVKEHQVYEPALILNDLSKAVIKALKQTNEIGMVKDGMDIALCKINYKTLELEYAGAHNALYLIRNGILMETKADQRAIGISMATNDFLNHKIKLEKGDCIYIFTDGFVDQKGGPENKKFFYRPFQKLLIDMHHLEMQEQELKLEKTISEWKGKKEQIDDILVIGVRI